MADAYMDGQWDTPDLARMVELIIENVKGNVVLGPPVRPRSAAACLPRCVLPNA